MELNTTPGKNSDSRMIEGGGQTQAPVDKSPVAHLQTPVTPDRAPTSCSYQTRG